MRKYYLIVESEGKLNVDFTRDVVEVSEPVYLGFLELIDEIHMARQRK